MISEVVVVGLVYHTDHYLHLCLCLGVVYSGQHVQQIDLAVTLAVLMAVPIPVNSLGVVIREALVGLSPADQLKAAYINARQMLRVAKAGLTDYTLGWCCS